MTDNSQLTTLRKGARITGDARSALTAGIVQKYQQGASIRALADSIGRSYGFVHRLLRDAGVDFRARGGATRRMRR